MKQGTLHRSIQGKEYVYNDRVDCRTNNVIYGIFCEKCDAIIYVGETGTSIYERFQNHISSVRNQKQEPIPMHFTSDGHSLKHFRIIGIERLRRRDIHFRKIREKFWIKKLGTIQPYGLNQNLGVGSE